MSREEREVYIAILIGMGLPINSWVIKTFDTKWNAEKYVDLIKSSNDLINNILPEQN